MVLRRHSCQSRSSHALEDGGTTELIEVGLSCICTPSLKQFKVVHCLDVVFELAAQSMYTAAVLSQPRPELSLTK